MITQKINLNLIHGQVHPRVNVSQYDNGSRTLQMTLYNGDQVFNIASGMTAVVQGTKPDRTGFQYAATITEGSNIATLDITQQMTAVKGDVTCELVISNGNNRIATANFILSVEAAALSDDTVISETDLPLIEEAAELAERIDGIVQQVNEDAQTASNAATAAQTAADEAEEWGTHPPYIGANGNWYVYDPTTETYQDSGVKAQGPLSGLTDVEITNAQDGQEITYDGTTQKWKNTSKIQTLTNQVKDMNNVYGSKNLLSQKYMQVLLGGTSVGNKVESINGLTIVYGEDGSIEINGTPTDSSKSVAIHFDWTTSVYDYNIENLAGEKVIGSITDTQINGIRLLLGCFLSDGTAKQSGYIYTNGEYTYPSDAVWGRTWLSISGEYSYNHAKVYPMIRLASITDDTYVPYAKTNKELTQDTTALLPLLDNTEVNGAVNLFRVTAASQVKNGVTFTVNDDGTVTANGTATATTTFSLGSRTFTAGKKYKLTGSPSGSSSNTYYQVYYNGTNYALDYGSGYTFTAQDNNAHGIDIVIKQNQTVSNLVFKPMITVASYNGDYVPYAKSNKELTDEKLDISSLKTITAASSDFADFKTRIAAL